MTEDPYNWFEHEWQAQVSQVRVQTKRKIAPLPSFYSQDINWDSTVEVEHVPIMKVEIAEPDLIALIRDLKHHKAHTEVQRRYPQLREAYMNYLSQVYLTVDKMPD